MSTWVDGFPQVNTVDGYARRGMARGLKSCAVRKGCTCTRRERVRVMLQDRRKEEEEEEEEEGEEKEEEGSR